VASTAARLQYAQANSDNESAWRVTNEFANSKADDFAASTVGEEVLFVSSRGGQAKIYRSRRDENDFLQVPEVLHKSLTDEAYQGSVSYAPSGQLAVYTRSNFQPGERLLPESGWEMNLMMAAVTEDGDFLPGKPFAHNGPGFSTGFGTFNPAGDKLYFASDRPGGYGGFDLYVSTRTDSGWGTPINLGDKVNSPGNEIAPQASGSALHFSSDYWPGFGGMDIYRADMLGESVSAVVNEGFGVNSSLDDVGFSVTEDGRFAYFTSNRAGGKGGLDVYRAMKSGNALTIAVVDGASGEPIANALLDFSDCGQGNFLTGVDGEYAFRAVNDQTCRPVVRKSGYNSKEFSLSAKTSGSRLEVRLNPEDKITIYEGKIIHSRTGDALGGVNVFARQKSGPFTSEATTDAKGRYELKLERQSEYVITYTLAGMATINREVTSYDADGAGILSTFAIFPDANAEQPVAATNRNPPTPAAPAEATPRRSVPREASSPPTRRSVSTPSRAASSGTVAGAVGTGYSVQVAALNENATDISEYQNKLAELGQVYGKRENGVLRVRVGPFSERREAINLLARVKSLGFSDAFIAKESGGAVLGMERVVREPAPRTPAPRTSTRQPTPVQEGASTETRQVAPSPTITLQSSRIGAGAGSYLIRLATYGNFSNFDAGKAAGLGTLTTRRRGEYTVVLVQGFANAADAELKVQEAIGAGFGDAHVVVEETDGTLRKVK